MRSRVIDKRAAPTAGRWDFPAVDHTAADALRGAAKTGAHLLTAGQLDALERQVKEEARQRGYEEGLAAGKAEVAARVARLEALVSRVHSSVPDARAGRRGRDRRPREFSSRAISCAARSSTIRPCCTPRSPTAWRCWPRTCATSRCTSIPKTPRSCARSCPAAPTSVSRSRAIPSSGAATCASRARARSSTARSRLAAPRSWPRRGPEPR